MRKTFLILVLFLNMTTHLLAQSGEPEVINGYTLPPEPDERTNNATILGIDFNSNGIRDDVERYIIKRFSTAEFPKTKTAIALQYVWANQKMLESPVIESKKHINDAIDCQFFWFDQKQIEINQRIIDLSKTDFKASIIETIKAGQWEDEYMVINDDDINDIVYNTRERIERDFQFNQACSGHIFQGRTRSLQNCQVNILELGE